MRKCTLVLISSILVIVCYSRHLKGGWIKYDYVSTNTVNHTNKYNISVYQYLDLNSTGAQIDPSVSMGIFVNVKDSLYSSISIPLTSTSLFTKANFPSCLVPSPSTYGYRVDVYTTSVDLPIESRGYTLAVQRCCRVPGMINVSQSDTAGFTYNTSIPGIINSIDYSNNSNPNFIFNDTVVICHNNYFSFSAKATDANGDSLVYSFCNGLHGGSVLNPKPYAPENPPYQPIAYSSGFSGVTPLGANVKIDAQTGTISGTAPDNTGDYTLAVMASEYRNGILISNTKKEIHITVGNCELSSVLLDTLYKACSSYSVNFSNQSISAGITSYAWDFGDTKTNTDTSSLPLPTYTYNDTGTYKVKLKVNTINGCTDSAVSVVKVYPVFPLKVRISNVSCYLNPVSFIDSNFVLYKTLPTYSWNFGFTSSNVYNPVIRFPYARNYSVYASILSNAICSLRDTMIFLVAVPTSTIQSCNIIANPSGVLLSGASVNFTAVTQNSGSSVAYQWYINGQVVSGANSSTFNTANLANNDSVNCLITSTDTCVSNKILLSKAYIISTKPSVKVEGRFVTKLNKGIKNVTTNNILANNGDTYSIIDSIGSSRLIKPTKNNDITKANGVTSIDALLTQRHILNTTKLNSPYKIIAADVDGNKTVNSVDILRMKRLILGTDTTFTKTVGTVKTDRLWEFVDSAYVFPDTTNPFPFKDSISFTNLTSNKTNQTFIGVKLGDVNYDWNPAVARGIAANSLQLSVNSEKIINNNLQLAFTSSNFYNINALQTTLHFDNTKYEFVGVENGKLQLDYNASKVNKSGNIAILWTDKNAEAKSFNKDEVLFTVVLKPLTVGSRLSTDIQLSNEIAETEAWDNSFTKRSIVLTSKENNSLPLANNQLLIYPNPSQTTVGIKLDKLTGTATLVITDVYGKQVFKKIINQSATTIDIGGFAKGVYMISAITEQGKQTQKLVVE